MRFRALLVAAYIGLGVLSAASLAVARDADSRQDSNDPRQFFAVEIKVGPNWDSAKPASEQAFFKEHSENLKHLRDTGHIIMGARYSDIGLIVFSATSADEVRELMDRDPSMAAGTFSYRVHAMNVFYPGNVGLRTPPAD